MNQPFILVKCVTNKIVEYVAQKKPALLMNLKEIVQKFMFGVGCPRQKSVDLFPLWNQL